MRTSNEKSLGSLIHLSTLSQYIIPLGNYIFPLLLWTTRKEKSDFIDHNGKQALNFQLSILLYSLIAIIISIPTFIFWLINTIEKLEMNNQVITMREVITTQNITGMVLLGLIALILIAFLKLSEFFLIIYASVKSANGEQYNYPLTIKFIK
ncbi:hypothetical protein SY27_15255 [Flavobacterium sp. 316]|uniref:DUF4870 domain-containing protein n=1 Tax=Flavobacterium sediminilitoris TaxID=2024526 RepID=A0ABY4HMJ7_9FLAO|nr:MULTISPECIES: DUF4870 domain-containing protein [Flavobacterium]KIX20135.1 hypothetical protein SY27_15255 [Flavobacterium sp. 316]UOX33891.1 DUF4870 domain-containing protein [Flavobacterium sediminilitoris]